MKSIYKTISIILAIFVLLVYLLLTHASNNPYRPGIIASDTMLTTYSSAISTLDPASSYYSYESEILDKVYEPPFMYHYLKRPYEKGFMPRTTTEIPRAKYFDKNGKPLPKDANNKDIARVEYIITIKKNIIYQPHPCFSKNSDGSYKYHNLTDDDVKKCITPYDIMNPKHKKLTIQEQKKHSRELTAADYVLQIRRLTDPRITCPIRSNLEKSIIGLEKLNKEYTKILEEKRKERKKNHFKYKESTHPIHLDFNSVPFAGAKVINRYQYKLVLSRKYPQILYWLAMNFFAPMPQEALDFYEQPCMINKEFTISRWPVGTGMYYVKKRKTNQLIVLQHNELHRKEYYPTEGEPGDKEAGYLEDAGKELPFIKTCIFTMEKEAIPRWNKFQQGYYDKTTISTESFDQTVTLSSTGEMGLSPEMAKKGIKMKSSTETSFYYLGFNMKDEVIGGYSEKQQKLRQAISIMFDYNEWLSIFYNDRGIIAESPIPPGILGYKSGAKGTNHYVDIWDEKLKKHVRQPLEKAKKLLAEAGYPNGIGKNGKQLTLYYDHAGSGRSDFKTEFLWMREHFAKIGINLEERGTELSRFREKVNKGNFQLITSGWNADYPDPENFLFLFYGPNSKADFGGPNSINYQNPQYDALFAKMETMENCPEREKIIAQMLEIIRKDAPAIWSFYPKRYTLQHSWLKNAKPHGLGRCYLKYWKIDSKERAKVVNNKWNKPKIIPVIIFLIIILLAIIPGAIIISIRREKGL